MNWIGTFPVSRGATLRPDSRAVPIRARWRRGYDVLVDSLRIKIGRMGVRHSDLAHNAQWFNGPPSRRFNCGVCADA